LAAFVEIQALAEIALMGSSSAKADYHPLSAMRPVKAGCCH